MSILPKSEVAVHAKEPVTLFGIPVILQPIVEASAHSDFLSFDTAPAVDVVDCKELEMGISAAQALPSISSDDSGFEFRVVPSEVGFSFFVTSLFIKNFFSVMLVVVSRVLAFFVGLCSVSFPSRFLDSLFVLFVVRTPILRAVSHCAASCSNGSTTFEGESTWPL
jgi:hypothetical protein